MRNRPGPPADPEDAEGFNDRGNRYSRNGVYDQAISDYTRSLNPCASSGSAGGSDRFLICVYPTKRT